MYRKRLVAMFAALLMGLSAGPAAALTTAVAPTDVQSVPVAPVQEAASAEVVQTAAVAVQDVDPEVDEELPGVGRLLVDIDEDNGTLTLGIGVTPAGIDESITLGGASGDDGDEGAPEAEAVEDDDHVEHRAEMDEAKDAVAAKIERTPRPAFAGGTRALSPASGTVAQGSGVTASARPTTTAAEGDNAGGPLADPSQNPWLQIMGVVMLAGTSTAWSIARREGLA